jgi:hypothetical protein
VIVVSVGTTVGALVFPVEGLGVIPADIIENPVAGYGRKRWPKVLEVFQTPFPLPDLPGLKPANNLREVQRFSQLAGDEHFLPHDLPAMGSGGQHMMQRSRCLKGRFDGKRFVSQTLNLFNE